MSKVYTTGAIDEVFEGIADRFERIEARIKDMERRVEELESRAAPVGRPIDAIYVGPKQESTTMPSSWRSWPNSD